MIEVKYLINTSEAEVQLLDGKVIVPLGGWTEITTRQAEHDEVVTCEVRKWIKVSNKKPDAPQEPEQKPLEFEEPKVLGKKALPKKEKVEIIKTE